MKDYVKTSLKNTISGSLLGINDINLRFSKKYPLKDSKLKKQVYDYHNAIYTIIKKANENIINISIDYQWVFSPILERPSMIDFDNFVKTVNRYNDNDVNNWLEKLGNR